MFLAALSLTLLECILQVDNYILVIATLMSAYIHVFAGCCCQGFLKARVFR